MQFPRMFRVRQHFDTPTLVNISQKVAEELASLKLEGTVQPGQSVAITVGSRGISNLKTIIKAVVEHFQHLQAKPFIVPAMGSHGGGTAEGQQAIVEGYGVTEAFLGCPIRSSMETVVVCEAEEGIPVHFDRHAFEADHVFVCNRIKPHTGFVGEIESGLMKMMLIGLGKHEGAKIYHRAIQNYSFGQIVRSIAGIVLERCRVVGGLGIVENALDETGAILAVQPSEFEEREKELLQLAKAWLPKLPFAYIDLLIVDRIGKNISGTGMDTNVVGRKYDDHRAQEDEFPKVKRLMVRSLTEETKGNGSGIGIAEFATTRAIEQLNITTTRTNSLTAGHPTSAMIPIHYPTDREVLEAALPTIGLTDPPDAKLCWILDTLHLSELECAEAFLPEAQQLEHVEILTEPRELAFDDEGNLKPMF